MNAPINPNLLRKALGFARFCKADMIADSDPLQRQAYAEGQAWHSTPDVAYACRSAVAELATTNSDTLSVARPLVRDFLALVRAGDVLGKLQGLRRVPHNVSMLRVAGGAVAHWRGEGKPTPVSAMSLERESLGLSMIEGLCIVTNELLRASGEAADLVLAAELIAAVSAFEDVAFLNPDLAATSDNPASVTYGAPSSESTGSTAAAIRADIKQLVSNFTDAGGALERAVLIAYPRSSLHLSMLEGTNGGLLFPDAGVRGGSISKIPLLTSGACELSGSPGESFMVMLDPARIMFAEDDGVQIEVAKHASLQANDAPGTGAQQLINLWQAGLRALKLSVPVSWNATGGVAVLRGIAY